MFLVGCMYHTTIPMINKMKGLKRVPLGAYRERHNNGEDQSHKEFHQCQTGLLQEEQRTITKYYCLKNHISEFSTKTISSSTLYYSLQVNDIKLTLKVKKCFQTSNHIDYFVFMSSHPVCNKRVIYDYAR